MHDDAEYLKEIIATEIFTIQLPRYKAQYSVSKLIKDLFPYTIDRFAFILSNLFMSKRTPLN